MADVDGATGNQNGDAVGNVAGNTGNGSAAGAPKVGSKLACASCGAAVVVVKAPNRPLSCCGSPLAAPAAEEANRG